MEANGHRPNSKSESSVGVKGHASQRDAPLGSESPVDGRWAVVVVIASFFGRAILAMQSSSMPMLTVEWEKRLGFTPSQVAWASTLVVSPRFLIAPVAGALNRRFGCRPVVFVGGICTMTSILMLSFTRRLWEIYTCSLIIGTSMGLAYQGSVIIVSLYFDKWLGRANGFAYAGVGIGLMIGSPLVALLIDVHTWRGALPIMAGIVGNLSVAAAVFRPLSWWSKRKRIPTQSNELDVGYDCNKDDHATEVPNHMTEELQPPVSVATNAGDSLQVIRRDPEDTVIYPDVYYEKSCPTMDTKACLQLPESIIEFQREASSQHNDQNETLSHVCAVNIRRCISLLLDWSGFNLLWRNSNILLLCSMAMFQGGGYFPSYVYLPSYVVSSGVSELRASFIFTILGLCSLVGRLTHGFLIDFKLITPTKLYGLTSILAGCGSLVIVAFGSYPAFVVYAIIFGLSTGAKLPLGPVMTKQYTAPSELANAFGLQDFCKGITQIVGTYLLGLLYNWTNHYRANFGLIGAFGFIEGAIAFSVDPFIRWRQHRRDENISDCI